MKERETPLSIVPLVPIPSGKSGIFSYLPEKNAPTPPPGSLVSLSFGRRTVRGIVWRDDTARQKERSARRMPFRLKRVNRTIAPAFLSPETISAVESIARISELSLGSIAERFVPKDAHREFVDQNETLSGTNKITLPKKSFSLTAEQKNAAKTLRARFAADSKNSFLLTGPPASGKTRVVFDIVRDAIKTGGQSLVIIPDPSILDQERERYGAALGSDRVAVFHSALPEKEKTAIRQRIRSGETSVVIGTPLSLTLPFVRLRLLVVDDADAAPYDRAHAIFGAPVERAFSSFARAWNIPLLAVSSFPSFASLERAKRNKALVEIKKSPPLPLPPLTLVNLRLERWKKKLSPVSEELRFAVSSTLEEKRQTLLLVGRSGMSAFSVCAECREVLRCQECTRALEYRKSGDYRCPSCGKSAGTTPACNRCGSLAVHHRGIGSERIERDLARAFPKARIVRYDDRNHRTMKTLRELDAFRRGERDILVTTELGAYGWDLPKLSLIAILDADIASGTARFDADERLFRLFGATLGRIRGKGNEARAFLQTFHPENPLFEFLKAGDASGFFASLADDRKAFLHPPFGETIRAVCRLSDEATLSEAVNRFEKTLADLKAKYPGAIRYSLSPPPKRSFGRTREREIFLSYNPDTSNLTADLRTLLSTLPPSWHTEAPPELKECLMTDF